MSDEFQPDAGTSVEPDHEPWTGGDPGYGQADSPADAGAPAPWAPEPDGQPAPDPSAPDPFDPAPSPDPFDLPSGPDPFDAAPRPDLSDIPTSPDPSDWPPDPWTLEPGGDDMSLPPDLLPTAPPDAEPADVGESDESGEDESVFGWPDLGDVPPVPMPEPPVLGDGPFDGSDDIDPGIEVDVEEILDSAGLAEPPSSAEPSPDEDDLDDVLRSFGSDELILTPPPFQPAEEFSGHRTGKPRGAGAGSGAGKGSGGGGGGGGGGRDNGADGHGHGPEGGGGEGGAGGDGVAGGTDEAGAASSAGSTADDGASGASTGTPSAATAPDQPGDGPATGDATGTSTQPSDGASTVDDDAGSGSGRDADQGPAVEPAAAETSDVAGDAASEGAADGGGVEGAAGTGDGATGFGLSFGIPESLTHVMEDAQDTARSWREAAQKTYESAEARIAEIRQSVAERASSTAAAASTTVEETVADVRELGDEVLAAAGGLAPSMGATGDGKMPAVADVVRGIVTEKLHDPVGLAHRNEFIDLDAPRPEVHVARDYARELRDEMDTSSPERIEALAPGFGLALVAAGVEEFIVNPALQAPTEIYEAVELIGGVKKHLDNGQYVAVAHDLKIAESKLFDAFLALAPLMGGLSGPGRAGAVAAEEIGEGAARVVTAGVEAAFAAEEGLGVGRSVGAGAVEAERVAGAVEAETLSGAGDAAEQGVAAEAGGAAAGEQDPATKAVRDGARRAADELAGDGDASPDSIEIPPGMSLNEMLEQLSREAYFPDSSVPNAKQPGVDLVNPVGGVLEESWAQETSRAGVATVTHDVVGGEWIQIKRLDPADKVTTSVESRIGAAVNEAFAKFDGPMKRGESTRAATLSDGTSLVERLSTPVRAQISVEVPGFEAMSGTERAALQRCAQGAADGWIGQWGSAPGTFNDVPVTVQVRAAPHVGGRR